MRFTVLYMVLVAIFFGNGSKAADILQVKPIVVLSRSEGEGGVLKGLPDIPKATQCGGSGDLRSVRCQGCKVSNGSVSYPTTEQILGEINYIPASDSKCLLLRIESYVGGSTTAEVLYDDTIINSEVKAGFLYTVHITTLMHQSMVGKKVRTKFIITDKAVSAPRLCVAIEANVI